MWECEWEYKPEAQASEFAQSTHSLALRARTRIRTRIRLEIFQMRHACHVNASVFHFKRFDFNIVTRWP